MLSGHDVWTINYVCWMVNFSDSRQSPYPISEVKNSVAKIQLNASRETFNAHSRETVVHGLFYNRAILLHNRVILRNP